MNIHISNTSNRIAIAICLLAPVLLIFTHRTISQEEKPQTLEGDSWLAMNQERKSGFVLGYTIGISRGFAEGCATYDQIVNVHDVPLKSDPLRKCFDSKGRGFSKPVQFYVDRVNDFYKTYPGNRNFPVGELIKKLSDSENLTPQEIHQSIEK